MDEVLFYVDPLRWDQVRLVFPEILRKELMEEMHVGFFSGYSVIKGCMGSSQGSMAGNPVEVYMLQEVTRMNWKFTFPYHVHY